MPNVLANCAHQQGSENHRDESHPSSSSLQAMKLSTSSLTTVIGPQTTNLLGNRHTFEVDQRHDADEQVACAPATLSRGDQANDGVFMRDDNDMAGRRCLVHLWGAVREWAGLILY